MPETFHNLPRQSNSAFNFFYQRDIYCTFMIYKMAALPGTLTHSVTSFSCPSLIMYIALWSAQHVLNTWRHYDNSHLATGDAVKR